MIKDGNIRGDPVHIMWLVRYIYFLKVNFLKLRTIFLFATVGLLTMRKHLFLMPEIHFSLDAGNEFWVVRTK